MLYIEAQLLPGGKGLALTGQLGEVMRESAEIARDLLWAEASQLDIDVKTFESNGMHVHVPAGAIPKDGHVGWHCPSNGDYFTADAQARAL